MSMLTIISLIGSLEKEATQDMLLALDELFDAVSDTDPLFEPAYQYFVEKLKGASSTWHQYLFSCIASLCKKSKSCVRQHFEPIFAMMFSVLTAKDDKALLAESAIMCIARLSESCKELMAPKALEFVKFLTEQLKTEDQQFQITLLKSLRLVICNEGRHLEPIVSTLLDTLLELGNREVTEATDVAAVLKQLEETGEAEMEFNEEEDNDELRMSPYAIPALALSVAASITRVYPSLIQPRIEPIVKGVQTQFKSWNKDALDTACKALTEFIAAARSTEVNKELGRHFSSIVLELISRTPDIDVAGACFTVMGSIVNYCELSSLGEESFVKLLELMHQCLEGKLICQENSKGYIDELHAPVCDTLREVVCGLKGDAPAKLQPFVPILMKWCTSKNKEFRDFSMKVLGDLVDSAPGLEAGFKNDVLQLALAAFQKDSSAGAYVINQFTNAAPELVAARAQDILHVCHQKLTQKAKRSVAYRALCDNSVALVGEIRRNVLKDAFPVGDFLVPCLKAMPAQYDDDANKDMFTFYVWLAQGSQVEPAELFAAAGCKLLCQPEEDIADVLDDGLGPQIVAVVKAALAKIPNAEQQIETWCKGDAFAGERLKKALQ